MIRIGIATAIALAMTAVPARAQAKVELGASLANLTIGLGDNDFTTFGVPSSFFGLLNPSVYASIFATPRISIDPKIGLVVLSGGGETDHVLSLGGQVNYFLKGTDVNSLYILGDVGLVSISDSDSTTSFGGGAGYRWLIGDRIAIRTEGRLTHHTDGGGNSLSFNLSMGGLFGKK